MKNNSALINSLSESVQQKTAENEEQIQALLNRFADRLEKSSDSALRMFQSDMVEMKKLSNGMIANHKQQRLALLLTCGLTLLIFSLSTFGLVMYHKSQIEKLTQAASLKTTNCNGQICVQIEETSPLYQGGWRVAKTKE